MQLYQIAILEVDLGDGKYIGILKEPYWMLAKNEQQAHDMVLLEYNNEGHAIDLERLAIIVRPFV